MAGPTGGVISASVFHHPGRADPRQLGGSEVRTPWGFETMQTHIEVAGSARREAANKYVEVGVFACRARPFPLSRRAAWHSFICASRSVLSPAARAKDAGARACRSGTAGCRGAARHYADAWAGAGLPAAAGRLTAAHYADASAAYRPLAFIIARLGA